MVIYGDGNEDRVQEGSIIDRVVAQLRKWGFGGRLGVFSGAGKSQKAGDFLISFS